MISYFGIDELKGLWRQSEDSNGEDNGQVTIVGGSSLFQGAPLMSLVAASRFVDMVFVATPEEDKDIVRKVKLFGKWRAGIWVPKEEVDAYIEKSDAVLLGPGMMRFHRETDERPQKDGVLDMAGTGTRMVAQYLLNKFSNKKWVIDGGSLQVMRATWIPKGSILTPNHKEYELLFNEKFTPDGIKVLAKKYDCVIVYKARESYVSDGDTVYIVAGGNAGLTKGGTGDVLAGVIVGLLAKNPPLLAASSGAYLTKKAGDELFETMGYGYNADDLALQVFKTKKALLGF